jgi:hypothetical protein
MITRSRAMHLLGITTAVTLILIGCAQRNQRFAEPTTRMATDIDPATTQPAYWYDKPAVAAVEGEHFQTLWKTAEEVARSYFFKIDRVDYRDGILTTEPMVSAQFFEPWRGDVRTIDASVESSLATTRRTIRFEFIKLDDGGYRVEPKVLIERRSIAEQRITSVVLYRQTFKRPVASGKHAPSGSRESDEGVYLPARYWYPIGRDEALEKNIAARMESRLKSLASK